MDVTLILIILLFGALATYIAGDKLASKVALLFSLAALTAGIYLVCSYVQGTDVSAMHLWITSPRVYLDFRADSLSLTMMLLTVALTPIIILTSFGNLFPKSRAFYALILFMAFAMAGTFLATDGMVYYIFWELSLIPIYFIALKWGSGDAETRRKDVVKFFIYTFAGSLFMLVAFIYLYSKSGSFLSSQLYRTMLSPKEQTFIYFAFFLAYAIKIPIIPFHTWQANVYQKAPAAGTMLLSGIMLKMALYSIVRWQLPLAPYAAKEYMYVVVGLCIAGVIYGSVLALKQTDLKKLLAYSSLAHVGLVAAGAYTLTLDGIRGAFIQMLAHGVVVVGLFYAADIIQRRFNTGTISEMGGIRTQAPRFTSMFMIIMLASVALPTTFNFIGEFELLYSLAQTNIWLAVIGGTTVILGAFYMLRMFQYVMLGEQNAKVFADVTFGEGFTFITIIAILLFFGLYPKPIVDFITPDVNDILVYIKRF